MNERTLYRLFAQELRRLYPAALVWKIPDTKGLGGKRYFDALLLFKGRAICIEFKFGKRRLTPLQHYYLGRAKRAGALVAVLDENNWKIFLAELSDTLKSGVVSLTHGDPNERPFEKRD